MVSKDVGHGGYSVCLILDPRARGEVYLCFHRWLVPYLMTLHSAGQGPLGPTSHANAKTIRLS
jgi:hypothetical protein